MEPGLATQTESQQSGASLGGSSEPDEGRHPPRRILPFRQHFRSAVLSRSRKTTLINVPHESMVEFLMWLSTFVGPAAQPNPVTIMGKQPLPKASGEQRWIDLVQVFPALAVFARLCQANAASSLSPWSLVS